MRNTFAVLTALFISCAFVGCNSKSPAAHLTPAPPLPPAPSGWALKLQSKCAEGLEDQCVGLYGFTVLKDGHFLLGPGPQGETRSGMLSPEDLAKLSTVLEATMAAPRLAEAGHQDYISAEGENPSDDTVSVTRGTGEAELLLKTSGTDLNFQTRSVDEAKALLSAIRNLARTYYALPFPDACNDGATSVQALFASMNTCAVDADCAYVNEALELMEPTSKDYLTTEDCTSVRPLAVGNASLVKSNKAKLEEALSQLTNACGGTLAPRSECEAKGIQLTGQAPTCLQGACQINPSH